jgi:hypothetical protein
MSSEVEQSKNPFDLLLCDSDALIQILCTDQAVLLKQMKHLYGIQAAFVEAVDDELTNPRHKFADLVSAPLQRAIANATLQLIDPRSMGRFTSNDPHTIYDSIQLRGQDYHKVVQRGEAYTHAAAVVLRAAVLSNDMKAVRTLDRNNRALPQIVARAYDIFALFHQRRDLDDRGCDQIRKRLTNIEDKPHAEFDGCKFVEGLSRFYPRLVDGKFAIEGSAYPRDLGDENRAVLTELDKASLR